jgi:hypothetical protein
MPDARRASERERALPPAQEADEAKEEEQNHEHEPPGDAEGSVLPGQHVPHGVSLTRRSCASKQPQESLLRALAPGAAKAGESRRRELHVLEPYLPPLERQPCNPAHRCGLELVAPRSCVHDDERQRVDQAEPTELAGCVLGLLEVAAVERPLEATVRCPL